MHLATISKNRRVIIAQSANPEVKAQLLSAIMGAVVSILPLVMQLMGEKEETSA